MNLLHINATKDINKYITKKNCGFFFFNFVMLTQEIIICRFFTMNMMLRDLFCNYQIS